MRFRTLSLPLAGVLGLSGALLAGCGSQATANPGPATPSVIHIALWESHNGGPVANAMSALAQQFDATHKNIQVSLKITKASRKALAAVAAGNPPLLAEISHYDGAYLKANALKSWNSFYQNDPTFSSASFFPAVWTNGEVNGQHYRFPADIKVEEFFYNKNLFQKAGITTPPATWTAMATDLAKLKSLGVIPLGFKDASSHILSAFMSNGGTMLKGSNTTGTAVNFNSAAGQQTFSYFHNLFANGEMVFGHGTSLRADLANGQMAIIDGTSAGYRKVLTAVGGKFPLGAFAFPAGSSGHAANLAQGLGFVLFNGHTPAEEKAAWTFLKWWNTPSIQSSWAMQSGFAPNTRAAAAAIPPSWLASHPGEAVSIQIVSSPYTVPRPISSRYKEVQAALDTAFYNAVTGKQSVSAALSSLDSQGNGFMSGASKL